MLSRIEPLASVGHTQDMPQVPGESGVPLVDLKTWIDAHGDRLLRSAFLLCGDQTEAEDLVQETLLQALKSVRRFRGDSAVYTWLHGILLNLSRRHWRKRKRLIFNEALVLQAVSDSGNAGAESDRDVQAMRLAQALRTLSPEHREVIVLRYYENLKIQEIAGRIGVSPGTVKSRLHYALHCLEKLVPAELNVFATDGTHSRALP